MRTGSGITFFRSSRYLALVPCCFPPLLFRDYPLFPFSFALRLLYHTIEMLWFSPAFDFGLAILVIAREGWSKHPFWARQMSGIFYILFGWWGFGFNRWVHLRGVRWVVSVTQQSFPAITQFACYSCFVYFLLASAHTICLLCKQGTAFTVIITRDSCVLYRSLLLFVLRLSPLTHTHCVPLYCACWFIAIVSFAGTIRSSGQKFSRLA